MKQRLFSLIFLGLLAAILVRCSGQKEATKSSEVKLDKEGYIEKYNTIAVQEMKRTGIPASITLAQGILESGYGQSRLAKEANNHFGIKCHDNWDGPSVREDDDKKNECFRKYNIAERSYIDHSKFLTTRPRYSSLFEYDKTAYKKWARGLQEAGYATNPNYAKELIKLIEKYNLYKYDTMEKDELEVQDEKEKTASSKGKVVRHNKVKSVIVQPGQSWLDIAKEQEIRLNRLHKYNDYYARYFEEPISGDRVYLQPKRLKGKKTTHKVDKGETMYSISQKRGIRLEKLYKRNKMEQGEEPQVGEKLLLKGKREDKPAIKTQKQLNQALSLREKERKKRKNLLTDDEKSDYDTDQNNLQDDINKRTDTTKHIVSEGETLYSISHQYYIPVNEVKSANDLGNNSLKPGQTLTIPPNESKPTQQETQAKEDTSFTATTKQETAKEKQQAKPASNKNDDPPAEQKKGSEDRSEQQEMHDKKVEKEKKDDTPSTTRNLDTTKQQNKKEASQNTDNEAKGEKDSTEKQQEASDHIIHTVQAGETLFRISEQYGTNVKEIKQLNNLASNQLAVGQELKVPGKQDPQQVASQSPNKNEPASEESTIPMEPPDDDAQSIIIHVVKEGETLYSISQKYKKPMEAIMEANENLESQNIEVGQKIKIPQEEEDKRERQEEEVQRQKEGASSPSSEQTHTVQSGETLYSISQKYDVSVEQLKELNNLSSNNLRVGQELTIEKQ